MLLIVFVFGGCRQAADTLQPLQPTRTLRAAFVVVDGVYNSELMAPMDILQHTRFHTQHAIEVFTVAPALDTVTTFEGMRIIPDYAFDSDELPPIDILVVPSAEHSMDTDLHNKALIAFVGTRGKQAQFTMSLCDGAFVLAQAGLLSGRLCTTFPSDVVTMREKFPELDILEDYSFVHDDRMITSVGGAKSYDAALYLTEILYGRAVAKGVAEGLVIEWKLRQIKFKLGSQPKNLEL
ncbi:MAG: glutamine amidotransferase [Bacteroidia bacterium]|nr:glutamine amidotransferase [Bacteroidia bacterium]